MRSRAERRHHHQRMLNKVKTFSLYQSYRWPEEEKIKHQKRMAETRKSCSCYMCGNPRKHWNDMTIQEKRELQHDME